MVGHDQWYAAVAVYPAAQARDAGIGSQQILGCDFAKCNYELRSYQLDLTVQVGFASKCLGGLRVAVSRRATFHCVRDINVSPALETDRGKHIIEQSTGLAYEGFALRVFLGSRTLADEQPIRVFVANA